MKKRPHIITIEPFTNQNQQKKPPKIQEYPWFEKLTKNIA